MTDHADNWMNGSMGGGTWIWTVIETPLVILLVVAISKPFRKTDLRKIEIKP